MHIIPIPKNPGHSFLRDWYVELAELIIMIFQSKNDIVSFFIQICLVPAN